MREVAIRCVFIGLLVLYFVCNFAIYKYQLRSSLAHRTENVGLRVVFNNATSQTEVPNAPPSSPIIVSSHSEKDTPIATRVAPEPPLSTPIEASLPSKPSASYDTRPSLRNNIENPVDEEKEETNRDVDNHIEFTARPPRISVICEEGSEKECDGNLKLSVGLEYDPFFLKMPNFATEAHKNKFFNAPYIQTLMSKSLSCPDSTIICKEDHNPREKIAFFTERHVQGYFWIVKDGFYTGNYDCGWFSTHYDLSNNIGANENYDKLVNLIVPDSWSFQHFVDGAFPKLVQAHQWIEKEKEGLQFLVSQLTHPDSFPARMLSNLGYGKEKLVMYNELSSVGAKEFLFTCATPPIHPFLWQEMRRLSGVVPIPFQQRNLIVYLQRVPSATLNYGRNVLNDNDLIQSLTNMSTLKNCTLVLYNHSSYSLSESIKLFNNAKVLIGPHGGAMYNQLFALEDTVVIEYVPYLGDRPTLRHPAIMVWTQSALLNHNYYHIPIEAQDAQGNMVVDVAAMESILDKEL